LTHPTPRSGLNETVLPSKTAGKIFSVINNLAVNCQILLKFPKYSLDNFPRHFTTDNLPPNRGGSRRKYLGARQKVDDLFLVVAFTQAKTTKSTTLTLQKTLPVQLFAGFTTAYCCYKQRFGGEQGSGLGGGQLLSAPT